MNTEAGNHRWFVDDYRLGAFRKPFYEILGWSGEG